MPTLRWGVRACVSALPWPPCEWGRPLPSSFVLCTCVPCKYMAAAPYYAPTACCIEFWAPPPQGQVCRGDRTGYVQQVQGHMGSAVETAMEGAQARRLAGQGRLCRAGEAQSFCRTHVKCDDFRSQWWNRWI